MSYPCELADVELDVSLLCKDEIVSELESYLHLEDGWNFGGGKAIQEINIQNAKNIYLWAKLCDLKAEVCPTDEGGILISLQHGILFLDITLNSQDAINISLEKGIGEEFSSAYVGNFHVSKAKEFVSWFASPVIDYMSEFLILDDTSASQKKGFNQLLSSPRLMAVESPYLMMAAGSEDMVIQSASTSTIFTKQFQESPAYIGNLRTTFYQ